jgi:hypothetical protein
MAWTFETSPRQAFINGWEKYVKPGGPLNPKPAPPDYYWSPGQGAWNPYPASLNLIEDKGWPQTDISGPFPDPGKIFDEIMAQYRALPPNLQHHAYWDPRIAKWMSLTARGTASEKQAALGKLFDEVNALHKKDFLSVPGTAKLLDIIKSEMGR